uniref:Uncharacterized protein n=1 Tax=Caenorhabditis japonica TaxID=281687 RepID=A0A8R1EKW4_CAEJA
MVSSHMSSPRIPHIIHCHSCTASCWSLASPSSIQNGNAATKSVDSLKINHFSLHRCPLFLPTFGFSRIPSFSFSGAPLSSRRFGTFLVGGAQGRAPSQI